MSHKNNFIDCQVNAHNIKSFLKNVIICLETKIYLCGYFDKIWCCAKNNELQMLTRNANKVEGSETIMTTVNHTVFAGNWSIVGGQLK